MGRRVLRRVLRRGSKKELSRRHLEGRSAPFRDCDPVGVCPRCRTLLWLVKMVKEWNCCRRQQLSSATRCRSRSSRRAWRSGAPRWTQPSRSAQILTQRLLTSGKTKEHKDKLLGPDTIWWVGGFRFEGVGAKKFGMSLETQGKLFFLRGTPKKLEGHPRNFGVQKLRTVWKSKFLYRYRPEGIFRIFSAWFWTPPGTYAFTAKKGKFICTGHFFPHGMAFLEKRGGLVPVYVFIFLFLTFFDFLGFWALRQVRCITTQKSGCVCRKVCESLFSWHKNEGILRHTTPHPMSYFGGIVFLLIWGVVVVESVFSDTWNGPLSRVRWPELLQKECFSPNFRLPIFKIQNPKKI